MKKHKKSTVHPSPPPPPPPPPTSISHHLALLPPTILTLTTTLSLEDKQILAYLLSKKTTTNHPHPPLFNCSCFRCYLTYWVRWDSSPNRHLIHQIIEAYEDDPAPHSKNKTKKDRRKKPHGSNIHTNVHTNASDTSTGTSINIYDCNNGANDEIKDTGPGESGTRATELSQPSLTELESVEGFKDEGRVRKLVSFLGERIWGVWI